MASRKRSAVWLYFHDGEDPSKAICLICSETIQHCGNTSNMLKHLRSKHQNEYAEVEAKKKLSEGTTVTSFQRTMQQTMHKENTGHYPEILESITGAEDVKQEKFGTEEATSTAVSSVLNEACCLSVTASKKRSAVWTYYQDDEDGSKALCLICLETIQHRRNTSNLLKHLRKRHPAEYADVEDRTRKRQLEDGAGTMIHSNLQQPQAFHNACRNTAKYPDILEVITVGQSEQEQMRRALEQEARALERERELTEQLRRAQEQEARALEQQRALTEQIRRAHEDEMRRTREQEARALQRERQAIEQLRRAQEQEARAIDREREALEQLRRELEMDRRDLEKQRGMAGLVGAAGPRDQEEGHGRGPMVSKVENGDMELEVTS